MDNSSRVQQQLGPLELSALPELALLCPLRGAGISHCHFLLRGLTSSSTRSLFHVSETSTPVLQHHLLKDLLPDSTEPVLQASSF